MILAWASPFKTLDFCQIRSFSFTLRGELKQQFKSKGEWKSDDIYLLVCIERRNIYFQNVRLVGGVPTVNMSVIVRTHHPVIPLLDSVHVQMVGTVVN